MPGLAHTMSVASAMKDPAAFNEAVASLPGMHSVRSKILTALPPEVLRLIIGVLIVVLVVYVCMRTVKIARMPSTRA